MRRMTGESSQAILDHLYDAVYAVAPDLTIEYWNASAETLTGYRAAEVVGQLCTGMVLMHVDEHGRPLFADSNPLQQTLQDGETRETHAYLHHQHGHRIPVHARITPIRDADGAICGAVEILSDDTDWRASQFLIERLHALALLDTLTEVGNRNDARRLLESRMGEWTRYGVLFSVLTVDIDNLHGINTLYGREIGDRVLRMVAQTLQHAVRSSDAVCRWGEDEFLVILVNQSTAGLHAVAEKLQQMVESAFLDVNGSIFSPTVTFGTTIASPADTVDTLMDRIDQIFSQRSRDTETDASA
jgi:diguanylate cyclase (GGDEF)-like protein/PAS domain S-box-containing protein